MRVPSLKVSQRRAIAAVEAAIILPFFFIILFAVWEVGRLIEMNQILSNAAREGARQCSTGTIDSSTPTFTVQTYVGNYLQNSGLAVPPASVIITVTNETQNLTNAGVCKIDSVNMTLVDVSQSGTASSADPVTTANPGDVMRVDVSYPFDAGRFSPVNSYFFLGYFNITATARWTCMKDQPIVVNSTIPSSP